MKKIEVTSEEADMLAYLVSCQRKERWEAMVQLEHACGKPLENAISETGRDPHVLAYTDLIEKITGSRDESYLLELAEEAREVLTPPEWWASYRKYGSSAFGPL